MPEYMVALWGWTAMLGGTLGLLGSFWRDRITGLLLERVALAGVAGASIVYGSVLLYVARGTGVVAASFLIGISIASIWRIRHVNRELRILTRWIGEHLA